VFLYNGRRITNRFETGLKSASKKAGIPWGRNVKGGWIFHDLRHTFITDMRRAGVPRTVTKSITGHAITDMSERYDVVSDEDKLEAIRRLENHRDFHFSFTEGARDDIK
jgi:integrase